MILKLTRNKIFIIGITLIVLFLTLNRLNYIIGSSFTTGQVIRTKTWTVVSSYHPDDNQYTIQHAATTYNAPIIKFSDGKNDITFQGETNMEISQGEAVNVIYKTANPQDAEIFSFTGFLLSPLLYCLLPLLILGAAAYSFINANEIISFDTATIFKKKN